MLAAIAEEFGVFETLEGEIPAAGRTDRAISLDVFRAFNLVLDDESYRRFLNAYLQLLPLHLRQRQGVVLPGMKQIVPSLASRDDVLLGLLTGNFRHAAWAKLKHFDLGHHFDFGGFGDRHEHRDDVARDALRAVHARVGADVDPEDIWIIGDTPADVTCARAIGASVIAVATGMFSAEELEQTAPDYLLEDCAEVERFLKLLI